MKQKLQKYLITGIISIIPIALTYFIIEFLFILISGKGAWIIELFLPESYTGGGLQNILGFILTIIFLYILGLIVSNVLGKKLYRFFESILSKIPIVSRVYNSIKQITGALSGENSKAFQKVILIEYPRKGLWTIAMVTGETMDNNQLYYNIFVPTTPNPTSGYLLFVKASDTKDIDISVEEGLKIIVSGGMIGPEKLNINE